MLTLFLFMLGMAVSDEITENKKEAKQEFLIEKWKEWYWSNDVDHDGIVSWKDVEKSIEKVVTLNHIPRDRADEVKGVVAYCWNKIIFRNGPGKPITEQEFIEHLMDSWIKDKVAFKTEIQENLRKLFDALDANEDGFMTLKELFYAYKAWGHDNMSLVRKEFDQFHVSDGKVPIEDLVDAWVIFIASDDTMEKNVVKEAYDLGL